MWMAESKMLARERKRLADGAPSRDLSMYSNWRDTARDENLELLRIYGKRLIGQVAGMGEALDILKIDKALEYEGIPEAERPDLAERLNLLHSIAMERAKIEAAHG